MSSGGPLLFLQNRNGAIDPLRYPCDIGRAADALLLFDSFSVVSDGMHEVVGLISWLGCDRFLKLLSDGSISFVLSQGMPEVVRFNEDKAYSVASMVHGGPYHPRKDDPVLRDASDLRHYLDRMLANPMHPPEAWAPSSQLADAIAARTRIVSLERQRALQKATISVFGHRDRNLQISRAITAGLERPTVIANGVTVSAEGLIDLAAEDDNALLDLNAVVDCVYELLLDAELASPEGLVSPLGEVLIEDSLVRSVGEGQIASFRRICELQGVPHLHNAVFTEDMPGEAVLALRAESSAKKFRAWLRSEEGASAGQDAVGAYVRAIEAQVRHDSLTFSGLRQITTMLAGIANPIVGALADVTDWGFSQYFFEKPWTPKLFVDGSLGGALRQKRAEFRNVHKPFDPGTLLREGFGVRVFKHRLDGVKLELEHPRENIDYKISYDDSEAIRAMLNKRLPQMHDAGMYPFELTCYQCGETSRIPKLLPHINEARCPKCRNPLFPLVKR